MLSYDIKALRAGCTRCTEEGYIAAVHWRGKVRKPLKIEGTVNKLTGELKWAYPLCSKWYGWYLIGYYEKYQTYCMFKLVRMEQIVITDLDCVKEHSSWEEHIGEKNAEKLITVRFLGKQRVKTKCKEYLNGEMIKEYENGDFEY